MGHHSDYVTSDSHEKQIKMSFLQSKGQEVKNCPVRDCDGETYVLLGQVGKKNVYGAIGVGI
jgi:hypothetical protein